jgi:hypothetical protein
VVIDFAQMSAGKMPAGMEALTRGLGVRPMQPPSAARNATYGEWPNERARTTVPSEGSLVGDHVIQGNYNPEIKFALNPSQDFLGALNLTTNTKNPSGSAQLGWGAVSGAQAYLATAIGSGGQGETVVMWTSSEAQTAAFAMPDYIAPGDLDRLVASPRPAPCPRRWWTPHPRRWSSSWRMGARPTSSIPRGPATRRSPGTSNGR